MDKKTMRYDTKIQLASPDIKPVNKQFALVDILLCYHGRNRNYSSMSKEVIENALPSLYGVPIVGEYIYLDDGSQDFGTHGGRIVVDDSGIKFEQTTKPYGFITEDAVRNATWTTIIEKNGIDSHEYLLLKNCVIWQSRYEEVQKLLDTNYGESMEIEINSYEYDEDNYMVIKDFTFSAACILGSHADGSICEPCYESSKIGRLFELDTFKQEFSTMMDEYKKYQNTDKSNSIKKGENAMDFAKITEKLSAITFTNSVEVETEKYALVDASDTSVFVLDREDYCLYSIDCTEVESEIVLDMDSKKKCALTGKVSEDEACFDMAAEIKIANEIAEQKVSKAYSEEYGAKVDELTAEYGKLKAEYDLAMSELTKFRAEEAERLQTEKKQAIDAVVEKYSKKIGKLPKFLCYRAKIDYSKEIADIESELCIMAGEAMMDKKQEFSYSPVSCSVVAAKTNSDKFAYSDRYGNLFDKFMNE